LEIEKLVDGTNIAGLNLAKAVSYNATTDEYDLTAAYELIRGLDG
jgi:hypothetical protein